MEQGSFVCPQESSLYCFSLLEAVVAAAVASPSRAHTWTSRGVVLIHGSNCTTTDALIVVVVVKLEAAMMEERWCCSGMQPLLGVANANGRRMSGDMPSLLMVVVAGCV